MSPVRRGRNRQRCHLKVVDKLTERRYRASTSHEDARIGSSRGDPAVEKSEVKSTNHDRAGAWFFPDPCLDRIPPAGAYFWVPRPQPDGIVRDLLTCHDFGLADRISHRAFWPQVLELLAVHWSKDAGLLKSRLRDNQTGLPRGRVSRPRSGYVIMHGNDAPMDDWLDRVRAGFGLTEVDVTTVFTEIEAMLGDDPGAVEMATGVGLS